MSGPTRPVDLAGWLARLETLHPAAIALGLDRVRSVAQRMHLAAQVPVFVVGGTNGKGSTTGMLEAMLRAAGYRTGLYTSPHLMRYNERVRIDGAEASDATLVEAFGRVEDARDAAGGIPLTYFEFGTLAALDLFARSNLDAWVLEVGLGGRLDAVNIVDADVAVITSIDLDHQDWLGDTREAIGLEKAGIFRSGRPAICGDPEPPASVIEHAASIGANLLRIGIDYGGILEGAQWRYFGPGGARYGLPVPALRGAFQIGNAASAIAALSCVRDRLPVAAAALRDGLVRVEVPARFQVLPGRPTIVLDVAHNPHAARALAQTLGTMGFHPSTTAVFGMLADKDIAGVVRALRPRIDLWRVADLPGPRGAAADALRDVLLAEGVAPEAIRAHASIAAALDAARAEAGEADRIVVFGSFLTVAAARHALD